MKLPFAFDSATKQPSMTLGFSYITFCIACVSLLALHFKKGLDVATWTAIGFWTTATVLYMVRKISKVKFDPTGKGIELESDNDDEKPSSSKVDSPDA